LAECAGLSRSFALPDDLQNFRVGGYNVLKKWLQPPHRASTDPHFQQIAAAISRTIELMQQINDTIAAYGGFGDNFSLG